MDDDGEWHRENFDNNKEYLQGGFGIVSKWRNAHTDQCLVLKIFKRQQPQGHNGRRTREINFQSEIDVLNSLKHDNVVSVQPISPGLKGVFEAWKEKKFAGMTELINPTGPSPILCMEFCNGGDLHNLLQLPENFSGLQEIEIRGIIRDLSNGLAYLHQKKVIHRDIKPHNVLLVPTGSAKGQAQYKLGDFGLSKCQPTLEKSFSTVEWGTRLYLAPEANYSQRGDYRVDYYSLALTILHASYGRCCFLENATPGMKRKLPERHHLSQVLSAALNHWLDSMSHHDYKLRGKVTPELRQILNVKSFATGNGITARSNALSWMLKYLALPTMSIIPHENFLLQNPAITVEEAQSQIRAWDPFVKGDLRIVIKRQDEATEASPNQLLPLDGDIQLFGFPDSLLERFELQMTKMLLKIGDSSYNPRNRVVLEKMWIEAFYALQKGILGGEQCLEILECFRLIRKNGVGIISVQEPMSDQCSSKLLDEMRYA